LFFAGQMIGVEGYLESAAAGLLAGLNAGRLTQGVPLFTAPPTTALGSMIAYISSDERRDFQPMNANYGLFPPLENRLRGREKKAALAERALRDLAVWQAAHEHTPLATVNPHATIVRP
jgi:methylenetetrahydrofolate--tRNA-(uracil-5-)-methyltransferase